MLKLLFIALGGAVGTSLRYGVGVGMKQWLGEGFPYGTLTVNLLGSILLAAAMEGLGDRQLLGVSLKLIVGTGIMGGFTTYSSFNLETLGLAEDGQWTRAIVYVVVTLVSCLAGAALGILAVRSIRG